MVVVSAGIKPRDELARACGLTVGQRGGVVVDDHLRTSDPDIFAIGEVALHGGMIYGLVAPGYEMAEIAAANLTGQAARLHRRRHVHQAQAHGRRRRQLRRLLRRRQDGARPITYEDPFKGIYKKLVFNPDGTRLLGGILVGDASDYGTLLDACQERQAAADAARRTAARQARAAGAGVRRGDRRRRPGLLVQQRQQGARSARRSASKNLTHASTRSRPCTKAGTGCGGCLPLSTDLFKAELKAAGKTGQQRPVRALRLHAARSSSRSSRSSGSRRSTS